MEKGKAIQALLAIFVVMPIWFYLLYKLLELSGATDVMWLLYWVYVPVGLFTSALAKITED